MIVKEFKEVENFYKHCYDFLEKYEAENNLIFGILSSLRENINYYHPDYRPKLLTVEEEKEEIIHLVSIRTPPYNQLVSYTEDLDSVTYLVDKLIEEEEKLPGVQGFIEAAQKFVDLWTKRMNVKAEIETNLRIFRLERVNPQILESKRCRTATKEDIPILIPFVKSFIEDIHVNTGLEKKQREKDRLSRSLPNWIEKREIFVLKVNNKIVSIVKQGQATPNGKRINLVYTPAKERNKGYATELVAWLCSKIIDHEGSKYCYLFTDLANPISNKIYTHIGFKPVIDVDQYKFD